MENIIKTDNGTLILNGGNPLEGCPKNWDEAKAWADKANEDSSLSGLEWSFDCGFKLNFDGSLLNVSSRFYPPKTHYGSKWDGSVSIFLMGNKVFQKEFECGTMKQLKDEVEKYVKDFISNTFL